MKYYSYSETFIESIFYSSFSSYLDMFIYRELTLEFKKPYTDLIGYKIALVRVGGELGIKSRRTRRRMLTILKRNISSFIKTYNLKHQIIEFRSRILIVLEDSNKLEDISRKIVSNVSGISSISTALVLDSEEREILEKGVIEARKLISSAATFAIRVRREGTHQYSSMDIASKLGSKVLSVMKNCLKVNLTDPEVEIFLDIRLNLAFLYSEVIRGIDGIPSESQGKVVALLKPHLNSIVSALLMKKRGVKVIPLYFRTGKHIENQFISALERFFGPIFSFIDIQEFLKLHSENGFLCFYCQMLCESHCRNIVEQTDIPTFLSPTTFEYNHESITFEALKELEEKSKISALRPIQFGFLGNEFHLDLLDRSPCCEFQEKVQIKFPPDFDESILRSFSQ
ncbi:MAG: THUMP domain-containing protein [Candidatus Hodarchaeales archaeon]